jgi:hypothetical protein
MKTFVTKAIVVSLTSFSFVRAEPLTNHSQAPFTKVEVAQTQYFVTEFTMGLPWDIPQRVDSVDESLDRWQLLVLLGQSNSIRLLSASKIRELYDPSDISDENIKAQKDRMIQRFATPQEQVRVERLYLVVDTSSKVARLVIPLTWSGGIFYTSYARRDGAWKIIAGGATPDLVMLRSKEIIEAYQKSDDAKSSSLSIKELVKVTTTWADPLLKSN